MDQPTSWCHLPMEMMAEVIKHLDFASRMKLRATARLEKELVESRKMAVESLSVDASYRDGPLVFVVSPHEPSGPLYEGFNGSIGKVIALTSSLIKFGKVNTFQIHANHHNRHFLDDTVSFLEKITNRGDFRFPIININHFNDHDFHSLIELVTPGTEILHLHKPPELGFKRVFRDYATVPVMLGASVIVLSDYNLESNSQSNIIVEAWLRYDQAVGKKVAIWLGWYNDEDKWVYERDVRADEAKIVSNFKNHFAGRVVEEKEKSVRIRMNDSKHILMRILEEEEDNKDILVTASWQVIPADMVEEQYDKKSGWVYVEC